MHRSFALLLAAAALAAAPSADAKTKPKPGAHAPAHHVRAPHRAARVAPPKDPYANYWNDPSRQGFPSWGLTGN